MVWRTGFHYFQLLLGSFLSLYIAYVGVENYYDGRPDLTAGRVCLAVILFSYTMVYIRRQSKYKLGVSYFGAYLVFYIVFALIFDYWYRGLIKNWAPSGEGDALFVNVVFVCVMVTLAALALYIAMRKPKEKKQNHHSE